MAPAIRTAAIPKASQVGRAGQGEDLRELFSFQLRQLANVYSKGSASVYSRRFGLTMNEWRVIALVHTAGALSINRLSEQAQFDRTLTSRIVRTLVTRRYLARRSDHRDGRGVLVSLTARGRTLVGEVFPDAQRRNDELLSCLSGSERQALKRIVTKLTDQAHRMLHAERREEAQPNAVMRKNPQPSAVRPKNTQPNAVRRY